MLDTIINISLVLLFFTLSLFFIAVTFPTIRDFIKGKRGKEDSANDDLARRMSEIEARMASLEQQLY